MSIKPFDFKQYEQPHGSKPYTICGDKFQTIKSSGSAPTLAADIIATLVDKTVTPVEMAKLAIKWGCRTLHSGTAWGYWKKLAEYYEFPKFVETTDSNELFDCLDAGGYVVCNMKQGYWCPHASNYILAWKYDNNFVYAHDASSRRRRKQSVEKFKEDCKRYFCFYPCSSWSKKDSEATLVDQSLIDKVELGLECCYNGIMCQVCPYNNTSNDQAICIRNNLIVDALNVITDLREEIKGYIANGKELDQYIDSYNGVARVWIEQKSKIPNKTYLFASSLEKRNYERPNDPNYYCSEYEYYLERDAIGKYWCAWKKKPTDEERKAVKWNE